MSEEAALFRLEDRYVGALMKFESLRALRGQPGLSLLLPARVGMQVHATGKDAKEEKKLQDEIVTCEEELQIFRPGAPVACCPPYLSASRACMPLACLGLLSRQLPQVCGLWQLPP